MSSTERNDFWDQSVRHVCIFLTAKFGDILTCAVLKINWGWQIHEAEIKWPLQLSTGAIFRILYNLFLVYIRQDIGQLKHVTALCLAHLMKPETCDLKLCCPRLAPLTCPRDEGPCIAMPPSLHALSCMFVRGRPRAPGCWAAGLLAGRGEVAHAGVALVFRPSLKRRDHLSSRLYFHLSAFGFWFCFCFVLLGKEPRASHMLGTCSAIELNPRPSSVCLYSLEAFEGLTV